MVKSIFVEPLMNQLNLLGELEEHSLPGTEAEQSSESGGDSRTGFYYLMDTIFLKDPLIKEIDRMKEYLRPHQDCCPKRASEA